MPGEYQEKVFEGLENPLRKTVQVAAVDFGPSGKTRATEIN